MSVPLQGICERLLLHFWKLFFKSILQIILSKGHFDESEMKGCSNQSRLKKNASCHKVLGEDKKH